MDTDVKEFRIYNFGITFELETFSLKNQTTLNLMEKLNALMDDVFKRISPKNYEELVVYMLGRICARNYNAILLLCSNGFGFDATRILRSMFEKVVDAFYLDKYPSETDDFVDFHILQQEKLGLYEVAEELKGNYQAILDRFKVHPKSKQTRTNWSEKSLKAKAELVGADSELIKVLYLLPNSYVHSSMAEVFGSLIFEEDDSVTPVEGKSKKEDILINLCFHMSRNLLIDILTLLIKRFNLPLQSVLDEYISLDKSARLN